MQHIDRKALYTDLEARVAYLHSFLDFGQSTSTTPPRQPRFGPTSPAEPITAQYLHTSPPQATLTPSSPGARYAPPLLPHMTRHVLTPPQYIQALIPAVVNIVYKKLLQYDITARAFTTRSTSFEGPMDETPDEESPQILHRKKFLSGYLKKLCSDPAQMEFFEYLDKVGMMHTGIGRAVPLHIEYVHIGAALGVIQDVFNEALLSHPRLSMQRKLAMVKALGKIIWIQNDLFAKWYVHDGEEYTAGVDYAGVVEKEGWLKGKKVLDDGDEEVDGAGKAARGNESDGSDDTAVSPRRAAGLKGGCPFAGVVAGGKKVTFDEGKMEGVEVAK